MRGKLQSKKGLFGVSKATKTKSDHKFLQAVYLGNREKKNKGVKRVLVSTRLPPTGGAAGKEVNEGDELSGHCLKKKGMWHDSKF